MMFLILINYSPLMSQDKIIFFDTEKEANNFIEGCRDVGISLFEYLMKIQPIDSSKIDNEKFINYKDVSYL